MIFIDTVYFLALLRPRDSLFQWAQAWAKAIHEPLIVTEYVLLETANALSSPLDRPKFHALMARLVADPNIEITPASARRPDKEWSLTDCLSFTTMEQRRLTRALTFDQHFEQAGFEALLRRDPAC